MKIRNGFISNSSSSSFIVRQKMTTAQIAKIMLYGVQKHWLDYDKIYGKKETDFSKSLAPAIKWLEENETFDKPIVFPWTTNYETFIWRDKNDNTIIVDTCNNQGEYWGLLSPFYVDDINYDSKSNIKFYALDLKEFLTERQYKKILWPGIY